MRASILGNWLQTPLKRKFQYRCTNLGTRISPLYEFRRPRSVAPFKSRRTTSTERHIALLSELGDKKETHRCAPKSLGRGLNGPRETGRIHSYDTFLTSILIAADRLGIQWPSCRTLILMGNYEDVCRGDYHYWRRLVVVGSRGYSDCTTVEGGWYFLRRNDM